MSRTLVFGMMAAALNSAAPAQDKPAVLRPPLPTEAFAVLPQVEDPALSPDGQQVAARVAANGKQYLAVMPLGGRPRFIPSGGLDLNWWRWVNEEWLLLGIGHEQKVGSDDWYISRAVAVHTPTLKLVPLAPRNAAQNADDVIWSARDGSARVLISYQTSIYVNQPGFWPQVDEVDLATGKRRVVQRSRMQVAAWYADGDGVVRMGIGTSEDGRSRRLLYRDTADAAFRVVDRTRKGDNKLTVPTLFLRDKGRALIIDDDEGGFSALYEFDLAKLERGKQLFASKGYDIGSIVGDGTGFGYLGIQLEEERSRTHWIDPEMAAMQASAAGLVKGAQAEFVSLSRDRSRAIVRVGGADAPGAWYVYRRDTNSMEILAYGNGTIGLRRMHPVRTIRYKARDGLEIAAVLTLPRGRSGKLPLIVMPHGGPFARDSETWDWWAQFLADRGYAVVQPNYRGSSGYGTPFTRRGEGQWGLAMQDDLDDVVKALDELGLADPSRVCMVGASYGGYAAIRAAQRPGNVKYRCAASYAGVSDLNRMLRYQSNYLYAGARGDWLRTQAPDLKDVSPLNFPEKFGVPLLLVHGDKDRVVPPIQSRALAQKLKVVGKEPVYIVQKEGDHHFSRSEDRLEFLKALERFLAEHNPA